MTTAIIVNIVLSAIVFVAVIGLVARTIRVSSSLPEHRLGRLRSPREHTAARRQAAYRPAGSQASAGSQA